MKYLGVILILFLAACASGSGEGITDPGAVGYMHNSADRTTINFLPDGSEVKIVDNKVYVVCYGKFVPMPDGKYMLADGTTMVVTKGSVGNKYKARKWQTHPDQVDSQNAG